MRKKRNRKKLIFIALFTGCCLVPLVTFPFAGNQNAESAQSAKEVPSLVKEGVLNKDFFSDAGDYFSYNFGFRQNLVTANARIKSGVFHTSDQDNVVLGKQGWLFYGSSMNDYLGYETMNDLQISEAVYNLELMQKTLEAQGIRFVFTIAPNKNSLYPQYMPAKYHTDQKAGNAARLVAALEKSDVNFVNLYALFDEKKEVLYHATDSHWNNKGAALVNQKLLAAAGRESTDYSKIKYKVKNDFTGDLFSMLYPTAKGKDPEIYYDKKRTYRYVTPIESTYDQEIETVNKAKNGNVVMFRDSFGNSLLPFVADEYGKGYFSRMDPFDVYSAVDRQADTVIAEIVERNLTHLQDSAPLLASPDISTEITLPENTDRTYKGTATVEEMPAGQNTYLKIYGSMDSSRTTKNTVTYISLFDEDQGFGYVFQAYHSSEDTDTEKTQEQKAKDPYGYCVYVNTQDLAYGNYDISMISQDKDSRTRSENLGKYECKED